MNVKNFQSGVTDILCSHSADGQSVAEIEDGRYSIIHDKSVSTDSLLQQISALAQQHSDDGETIDIQGKTIQADIQSLSEREASKANSRP